jgi:hypothetical protein
MESHKQILDPYCKLLEAELYHNPTRSLPLAARYVMWVYDRWTDETLPIWIWALATGSISRWQEVVKEARELYDEWQKRAENGETTENSGK